ncbi:chaplin family protein [Streptomyces sp. NPDC051133]|uniref:chaplin n=1 Tax=Streptomyces sp. NPDC051133 TaxID=3155521 RepID=UPI003421DDE6
MNRVTRHSAFAVIAATGAMAVAVPAYADATADGSTAGSPGLISGNGIQLPVHVPVNVCGNTVSVAGLLNPAMGNGCANGGAGTSGGTTAQKTDGAQAVGKADNSPGVVSGNDIQLPVHLPVNVSGNSVNVVGIANPVFGNTSVNGSVDQPAPPRSEPSKPSKPPTRIEPPAPSSAHVPPESSQSHTPQQPTVPVLAQTGAEGALPAAAAGAALLLGGAVLYRGFRTRKVR